MAFSCNLCGHGWTGLTECHCGTCCESFSTVANFDRHRVFDVDGDWDTRRCLTPDELANLRSKSGQLVLTRSKRKLGYVWVGAGFPDREDGGRDVWPQRAHGKEPE